MSTPEKNPKNNQRHQKTIILNRGLTFPLAMSSEERVLPCHDMNFIVCPLAELLHSILVHKNSKNSNKDLFAWAEVIESKLISLQKKFANQWWSEKGTERSIFELLLQRYTNSYKSFFEELEEAWKTKYFKKSIQKRYIWVQTQFDVYKHLLEHIPIDWTPPRGFSWSRFNPFISTSKSFGTALTYACGGPKYDYFKEKEEILRNPSLGYVLILEIEGDLYVDQAPNDINEDGVVKIKFLYQKGEEVSFLGICRFTSMKIIEFVVPKEIIKTGTKTRIQPKALLKETVDYIFKSEEQDLKKRVEELQENMLQNSNNSHENPKLKRTLKFA